MIRRPPRSTLSSSSAASDVYKRQLLALPSFRPSNTTMADRPTSQGSRPPSQPNQQQTSPNTQRAQPPKHVSFRHDPRVSIATQALQHNLSDDQTTGGGDRKSRLRRVSEGKGSVNESSPLLGGRGTEEVESRPSTSAGPFSPGFSEYSGVEDHTQETKSSWYLFLLTSALGG